MGESCTVLLPPLRGGVEGRGGGVIGRCDMEVGKMGRGQSLAGGLAFLTLPRRSSVGDTGTGGSPMDFFGGVLGGGKLAFELRLSVSSRVIPDSSGGVDSMRGLMPPSRLKKRWSSEDNCGLEELLLGVRAGREEGGIGDVCATSELLTADEGGNDDELARA